MQSRKEGIGMRSEGIYLYCDRLVCDGYKTICDTTSAELLKVANAIAG